VCAFFPALLNFPNIYQQPEPFHLPLTSIDPSSPSSPPETSQSATHNPTTLSQPSSTHLTRSPATLDLIHPHDFSESKHATPSPPQLPSPSDDSDQDDEDQTPTLTFPIDRRQTQSEAALSRLEPPHAPSAVTADSHRLRRVFSDTVAFHPMQFNHQKQKIHRAFSSVFSDLLTEGRAGAVRHGGPQRRQPPSLKMLRGSWQQQSDGVLLLPPGPEGFAEPQFMRKPSQTETDAKKNEFFGKKTGRMAKKRAQVKFGLWNFRHSVAWASFLSTSPEWFKWFTLCCLLLNFLVFPISEKAVGWMMVAEFVVCLAESVNCFPLPPGGLIAAQAVILGLTGPHAIVEEIVRNIEVILLLLFSYVFFLVVFILNPQWSPQRTSRNHFFSRFSPNSSSSSDPKRLFLSPFHFPLRFFPPFSMPSPSPLSLLLSGWVFMRFISNTASPGIKKTMKLHSSQLARVLPNNRFTLASHPLMQLKRSSFKLACVI
jgi:hypothetical protein